MTFPSPAFQPAEGPQPPLPASPLGASQAVLTFLLDASPGRYRATVQPTSGVARIVAERRFERSAAAGVATSVEIAVPLEEGENRFQVTVQDELSGAGSRTSGPSPVIVRDLKTTVQRISLDAIQPATRVTSGTEVTLEFTLNGTASNYQIDVIRNAASATTFTTSRTGFGSVQVPLLPNTSNDFFLRVTANDPLATGVQVSSNILSVTADSTAPVLSNVAVFPGPVTDNAVVNVIGDTEPFALVTVTVGDKTFSSEADLAGSFVILGIGVPFEPPGPSLRTLTIQAVDQAGNRSLPRVESITRNAADPRFEFLELSPQSGSFLPPGMPLHVRGSVGERTGPFDVSFFLRQTTGSFQLEERLQNLAAGAAFEKDFHLTADVANPNSDIIYSVEAQVTSTAGQSARQLVGEVTFDAADPPAPDFASRFDQVLITNANRVTADGASERFSTIFFSAFPGLLVRPSTRVRVDSTPIVLGGEFRSVVDLSNVPDGIYSVTATAVAVSGRFSESTSRRELRIERDTTGPRVLQVTVNGRQAGSNRTEFFGGGQFVTLRIRYSEPMRRAPEVFVTQRGSFALPAALSATVLPDLVFEYTYVTLGGDFDGPAEVVVTGGQDRAGNPLDPEERFSGLFVVDSRAPVIDPANTRPVPGSVVSSAPEEIFISILENPRSVEPASGVDIERTQVQVFGPLETTPTREQTGFLNVFSPQTVTFRFDRGQFVEPGTYQVRVTVFDVAGNSETTTIVYLLDTDPINPVFLVETTPPDDAILAAAGIPVDAAGRTVLSARFSPISTPELDLDETRITLEQSCPSVFSLPGSIVTSPPDRLSLRLDRNLRTDGSDDGLYLMRIFPRDIAGNITPDLLRRFILDTTPPAVQDGSFLELGRFGNTTEESFFPVRGQLVTGPLTAIRSILVDGVARNGYPGSGINTDLATGSTVVLTLLERHPTTLTGLAVGAATTNSSLLQGTLKFVDIQPPITSPCFTGLRRATVMLELRVDPISGRPLGLTTGFDGRYEIRVLPIDRAGNRGPVAISDFILDTVPPEIVTLEGAVNGDVLTGRALRLSGTVRDNVKTADDFGQGIDRMQVSLLRADASFVTTGAPLIVPTTTTLAPNVRLVRAGTPIHYAFEGRIPDYNGNAVVVVEAFDVAGNRTVVLRQIVIQNMPLDRPVLSEPPLGTATSGPVVSFRWQQVPGASGYRLTITDPLGNDIVRTTDRAAPFLLINLDRLIEGRYSWTVAALDTAGQPGTAALRHTFILDVTPPVVQEVFTYDSTVPDANGGAILNGQIRIGLRFSEPMDPAAPPAVSLRPSNPDLPTVPVLQISYDEAVWRGLVDLQPDPQAPDFNGTALIQASGARDPAGNLMPITSQAVEVDVGPFWQVRAFANPVQKTEILFHVKALTQQNGVPELIAALPVLTVTQPGAPPVTLRMRRLTDSVFSGVYTVNQSFPGNALLAITGSDGKGNQSTRLLEFSISAIVAANRNRVLLPGKAGAIELPEGALPSDLTLVAFGSRMAASSSGLAEASSPAAPVPFKADSKDLSERGSSQSAGPSSNDPFGPSPELVEGSRPTGTAGTGLTLVAVIAGFVPESLELVRPGEVSVDLSAHLRDLPYPVARLGLYRMDGGRPRYQPGRVEADVLKARVDGISAFALMADLTPPALEIDDSGKPGVVDLDRGVTSVRLRVLDTGSGLDPASVRASIDGADATAVFDAGTFELTLEAGRELAAGRHAVTVEAADHAGNKSRLEFTAHAPGHAEISEAIAVPNPARFTSGIRYRLSGPAASARIRVHDMSGRVVFTAEGTADPGVNTVSWPLVDRRGEPVANGVYAARIRVEGTGGPPARATVKIAVLR